MQLNRRYKKRNLNSEINITPFVDVMLVLLVIFMVTAPMLNTSIPLELPSSQGSKNSMEDSSIIISVTKNGDVYLYDKKMEFDMLTPKLKIMAKNGARVFIKGDKNVNYGLMVKVFNVVRQAGYYNIGLVTEAE